MQQNQILFPAKEQIPNRIWDPWEELLVMALILYAIFYVFLVLLNFFHSFEQESNKLKLSQWKKGERGKC